MKRTFAAGLMVLISFSLVSGQEWIQGSLEDARTQSKVQKKPLLLHFHREGG